MHVVSSSKQQLSKEQQRRCTFKKLIMREFKSWGSFCTQTILTVLIYLEPHSKAIQLYHCVDKVQMHQEEDQKPK